MNNKNTLIGLIIVLGVLMLLAIGMDFLALHDIKQDYVSPDVLREYNISLADILPEWTATKTEWISVQISMILKAAFVILSFFFAAKALRK